MSVRVHPDRLLLPLCDTVTDQRQPIRRTSYIRATSSQHYTTRRVVSLYVCYFRYATTPSYDEAQIKLYNFLRLLLITDRCYGCYDKQNRGPEVNQAGPN